jgi:pimeloyl-ACP methyl ester carboxylesterase
VTAHGTGGSFRTHVLNGTARVLSRGSVKFAVLGIDQVVHGPRRGASTESPDNLFFNFLNPDAARGNPLQGAADQLSLMRFAATIDGTGDMPTTIDPTKVVFFGHSQGGTEGSLMLPYGDDYKAAVLSGNGGSLIHALLNKTSPVDVKAVLPFLVQDPSLNDGSDTGEFSPVLTLLQQWIDPADPLNFARLVGTPPAGHTMKSTFETYGLGDTYAPPVTLDNYSIAGRFVHVEPVLLDILLPHAPPPVAGNLSMGMITLGMRQYEPADGDDGHFVVFDVPQANQDMVRFLSMAASGQVPAIGQ